MAEEPSNQPTRIARWKIALSALVAFHVFCVVVAPNRETYLGYKLRPLIEPYIFPLGFFSSWGFFSPDPGPPPVFVEWELLDRFGKQIEHGKWPEEPSPFKLREQQNRRIAMVRFMVQEDQRAEQVMLPYLCSRPSHPSSVNLWRVSKSIPNLHDVADEKRAIGDEVGEERRFVSRSYCKGSPG